MAHPPAPLSWTCPSCDRLVPGRVRQCRCGFNAGPADEATAAPLPDIRQGSAQTALWLGIATLAVIGGAAAIYLGSERSLPAAPVASAESPAVPAIGSGALTQGEPAQLAPSEPIPAPRLVPIETVSHRDDPPTPPPGAAAASAAPRSIEEIVVRAAPAVVLIRTSNSAGTGFFVTQDLLLTNAHVVSGQSFVDVRLAGGETLQGRVERTSPDLDLAVVRASARPGANQILQLGSANAVRPGQEVLAIGSPLGLQNTVTRGIVSAVRDTGGVELIQTDAAINPGNSGGPLLDRDGRVIGVTTLKMMRGAESLGFAVAIAHAVPLIEGRAVPPGLGTAQAPSLQTGLAAGASETDMARRNGASRFEQAMQQAAQRADQIDAQFKRFTSNCLVTPVAHDGQRDWFIFRDQAPAFKTPDTWCSSFANDLQGYARQFGTFMADSSEQARRAGVYPGTLRETRRKYRVDWTGWDR
jgi:S1-C subfamily serine protease